MTASEFMNYCITVSLWLVVASLIVAFIRLAKGPTLVDRVLSLDMLTAAVIVLCSLYAIQTNIDVYLDIAIALALVSFISVIALAKYASRQVRRQDQND